MKKLTYDQKPSVKKSAKAIKVKKDQANIIYIGPTLLSQQPGINTQKQ